MLEVDHISFSYGRHTVLDDVAFDVAPGEIVALAGPNGAGKTTLLRLLSCLLMQDSGTVRLDNINPLERPIKYRRAIGYLSEHCPLYSEMTVEEYLIYRVRLKGERSMRVRRRVSEALEDCGLEEQRKTRIRLLSQGFRKRVGLADALVQHPKLLLLDDPLAGLRREAAAQGGRRADCGVGARGGRAGGARGSRDGGVVHALRGAERRAGGCDVSGQ